MMVETSIALLTETVDSLKSLLSSGPVLLTDICFAEPGMGYSPNEDDFQKVR